MDTLPLLRRWVGVLLERACEELPIALALHQSSGEYLAKRLVELAQVELHLGIPYQQVPCLARMWSVHLVVEP